MVRNGEDSSNACGHAFHQSSGQNGGYANAQDLQELRPESW